jgi:hypothetical protein
MTLALECEQYNVWYIHIYTENWYLNLDLHLYSCLYFIITIHKTKTIKFI